jgi:hypothetical protein
VENWKKFKEFMEKLFEISDYILMSFHAVLNVYNILVLVKNCSDEVKLYIKLIFYIP